MSSIRPPVTPWCVRPADVREAEGPHADPRVQHGESQSGRSPHMLLRARQQEGQRLSALSRGRSADADPGGRRPRRSPYPITKDPQVLLKLSLYTEGADFIEGF